MGWASGSSLAINIWKIVSPYIPESQTQSVARVIWADFEDHDCDTLDEAEDLARACNYDYYEDCEDELVCCKWDCVETAEYMGKVCGLHVQVCQGHLDEVTNSAPFPED